MNFVQGINRNQLYLMNLDEHVTDDSWARIVDWFVDSFDLEKLGFCDVLQKQGRPPFHSSALLKLYLYGYKNSLRSSRKLQDACKINLELIWLLKGLSPSARTIAYFRKNNQKAIKNMMQEFVLVLHSWNLISGETIAIDSFKIRAQNSLKNNFNQKKIDRHIHYIDNKIDEYENVLKHNDKLDLLQKDHIKMKIKYNQEKKQNYKNIEKELNLSSQLQLSKTDPDARSVVLHRNIVNVGYNIQASTDSKHKLFINAQTGDVNDTHALAPMALEVKRILGLKQMNTLTDKGYTTGEQISICTQNNITTYSSPKNHSSNHNGLFSIKEFVYHKANDTYICLNNEILSTNGNYYKKGNYKVKHYMTKACENCKIRDKCTKNKKGRLIERSIYQVELENNEQRVNSNPDYYRLRQQITEHQFGTIKRQWGFTYTLMKGKENVLTEVNLIMTCYNLRRIMSIFGVNELKRRLKYLYCHSSPLRHIIKLFNSKVFHLHVIFHSA